MPYKPDPIWQAQRDEENQKIIWFLNLDEMPNKIKELLTKFTQEELELMVNSVRNAKDALMIN